MTEASARYGDSFFDDDAYYVLDVEHRVVPATQQDFDAMPDQAKLVAQTPLGNLTITTEFVGFDLATGETAEPMTFQTRVTAPNDGWSCEAYASWAEAKSGHEQAVAHYRGVTSG